MNVRCRPWNHLAKFAIPAAALAVVSGGYFLWKYHQGLTIDDIDDIQDYEADEGNDGPADERCCEKDGTGAGLGNLEPDGDRVSDSIEPSLHGVLLQQYDWALYEKLSAYGKGALEVALLRDLYALYKVEVCELEANRLLCESGLRVALLESWERQDFGNCIGNEFFQKAMVEVSRTSSDTKCLPDGPREEPCTPNKQPATEVAQPIATETLSNAFRLPLESDLLEDEEECYLSETDCDQVLDDLGCADLEALEDTLCSDTTNESIGVYNGRFYEVKGDLNQIFYNDDQRERVSKWYSSIDFWPTHNDISKKRAKYTGKWLLSSEAFVKWRKDPSQRLLWCPGIPGVGKTTIASLVIDHLCSFKHQRVVVGFVYFNYKLQSQQNLQSILECLCRQVYEASQGSPDAAPLQALFERSCGSRPTEEDLIDVLGQTSQQFEQFYIALDALDEYSESYNNFIVQELLTSILAIHPTVKILVTSRIFDGMEEMFERLGANKEEIVAEYEDIAQYVRQRTVSAPFSFTISRDFMEQIIEKVAQASGGRFLMAELHMNTLADQLNPGSLKDALNNLPQGIDATYERVLLRIQGYPEARRDLALRTLMWVARSLSRLAPRELQHALATKPGISNIEEYVTPVTTITALCAGLVIIRDSKAVFVHFTAQNFFDDPRIRSEFFPDADNEMLRTCIDYVLLNQWTRFQAYDLRNWTSWYQIPPAWNIAPLFHYAVMSMGVHASAAGEEACYTLDMFLASRSRTVQVCSSYMLATLLLDGVNSTDPRSFDVFLAIYYDRAHVLGVLLDDLSEDPRTMMGKTLLTFAIALGKLATAETLLYWKGPFSRDPLEAAISSRRPALPLSHVKDSNAPKIADMISVPMPSHADIVDGPGYQCEESLLACRFDWA